MKVEFNRLFEKLKAKEEVQAQIDQLQAKLKNL